MWRDGSLNCGENTTINPHKHNARISGQYAREKKTYFFLLFDIFVVVDEMKFLSGWLIKKSAPKLGFGRDIKCVVSFP